MNKPVICLSKCNVSRTHVDEEICLKIRNIYLLSNTYVTSHFLLSDKVDTYVLFQFSSLQFLFNGVLNLSNGINSIPIIQCVLFNSFHIE